MRAEVDLSSDEVTVAAGRTRVRVSLRDGAADVSWGRWRPIAKATALVEFEGGATVSSAASGWRAEDRPRLVDDAHGRGTRVFLATDAIEGARLHLDVCAYDEQPFVLLRVGVENTGRTARRIRRFVPLTTHSLAFESPPAQLRFLRHGWQSWTPTLSLAGAQRDIDVRPPVHAPADVPDGRGAFASEEFTAISDPVTGRSAVLGFVTAHRQWTQVRVDASRQALDAVAFADGATVAPGETLWSERLLIELTDDVPAALARYAGALGREMGARVPREVPTGWCSWYYYFTNVTEADILANLDRLRGLRDRLPFDYVQIDDGYQADIGDWTTTNEKFPNGMRSLAEAIRDAGFKPGLWLAPFIASKTSQLYAEHPDWMVHSEQGGPALALHNWGSDCYGLDCTHPDAEAWLRDLFRTVTRDWTYDYVKIDFLYGGALAGRRCDASASRIEAYRRGLRAIRASVGKRFVLGCGALMGASAGIVDGQRIGPDVAPWWRFNRPLPPKRPGRPRAGGEPSMENALRNVFTRSWMHGRLWANDPDCLLVREDRTKLTLPEVQSLATAIGLSGGMVLLSDNVTTLSAKRLDIVSLLLPPIGDAPVVPDLMDVSMPARMEVDLSRPFGSWRLLGAFNWTGRRQSMRVPLPRGRWHVFELWEERHYGVREQHVNLQDMPSHGARLLALRRAVARPQLIATTFHVSMGGREIERVSYDARRKTLRVALTPVAKKDGAVFVHAPAAYRLAGATLDGESIAPKRNGRVLRFAFTLDATKTLTVRFR
ncbi:MAG: glycoside hydrolase family 36 protein [Dehalococcoidia bacterium]